MGERPQQGNGGPQVSQVAEAPPVGVFVYLIGPGQIRTEVTVPEPVVALGLLEVAKKVILDRMGEAAPRGQGRIVVPQVRVNG